jgi:hypothetical protein
VRALRPGMMHLTETEIASLSVGSMIVWAELGVYVKTGPNAWSCKERGQYAQEDRQFAAYPPSAPGNGALVRVGFDWEVAEEKVGDATAFAGAVAEFARTDPAFRAAIRRTTSELRDLAEAIDQLDPRTRR